MKLNSGQKAIIEQGLFFKFIKESLYNKDMIP